MKIGAASITNEKTRQIKDYKKSPGELKLRIGRPIIQLNAITE